MTGEQNGDLININHTVPLESPRRFSGHFIHGAHTMADPLLGVRSVWSQYKMIGRLYMFGLVTDTVAWEVATEAALQYPPRHLRDHHMTPFAMEDLFPTLRMRESLVKP